MSRFFDVDHENLSGLSPVDAVRVLHSLLFAEASLDGGIDPSKICVPSSPPAVSTPDGGIDAVVRDAHPRGGHGIVKDGLTCYQVKSGKTDIRNNSDAKRAISVGGRDGRKLNPGVSECLREEGTLVVALFGSDRPEKDDQRAVRCLREEIGRLDESLAGYERIEVWRQSKIIGLLRDFPSVRLEIKEMMKKRPNNLLSIWPWSRLGNMRHDHEFFGSDASDELIRGIQDMVRGNAPVSLRVVGDPGVGKTRLVLEALSTEEIGPAVIYAQKPSDLPKGFLNSFAYGDDREHCVLVVDECDPGEWRKIWNLIAPAASRVRLITIYDGEQSDVPETRVLRVEPLGSREASAIIASYGVPDQRAKELAGFCSGSPEVAHILGGQAKASGAERIDIERDFGGIWDHLIAGSDGIESEPCRRRRAVLKGLSLFRRFGYDGDLERERREGAFVVGKIAHATGMAEGEIREAIADLRGRGLLHGDRTLSISPKMLHLWLWSRWWGEQGAGFSWEGFRRDGRGDPLPPGLEGWFFEMFQYGADLESVKRVAGELLGPGGPFCERGFLESSTGASLLVSLSKTVPEETLNFIESWISRRTPEELRDPFSEHRGLVAGLEIIARLPRLFERAANSLLELALTESDGLYVNNATGTFAVLFGNGYGSLAPSGASPERRFRVLENAAKSEDVLKRPIAIKAIAKALDVRVVRMVAIRDADLLREESPGWMPETYGELLEAYHRVWLLGCECLELYGGDSRLQLERAMESNLIPLFQLVDWIEDGGPDVAGWARELWETGHADRDALIRDIALTLARDDAVSPSAREGLCELLAELKGIGYEGETRRLLGGELYQGGPEGDGRVLEARIELLASASLTSPSEFEAMLPWLVSIETGNVRTFGAALERVDKESLLWGKVTGALRDLPEGDRATSLCLGYLGAAFDADQGLWGRLLDGLAADGGLAHLVPALTCGSGASDGAMGRALTLLDEDTVDARGLEQLCLFGCGDGISDGAFVELVDALVSKGDPERAWAAVRLAYLRLARTAEVPPEVESRVLGQEPLLAGGPPPEMPSPFFCWQELAMDLLSRCPSAAEGLADRTLEIASHLQIYEYTYLDKVIKELIRLAPDAYWSALSPRILGEDEPTRRRLLYRSAKGPETDVTLLPKETVLSWVDEEPDSRAALIALCAPRGLYDSNGRALLARELLARYGARQDVREALYPFSRPGGWTGNLSDAVGVELSRLIFYKECEQSGGDNHEVLEAVDDMRSALVKVQKRARVDEERHPLSE